MFLNVETRTALETKLIGFVLGILGLLALAAQNGGISFAHQPAPWGAVLAGLLAFFGAAFVSSVPQAELALAHAPFSLLALARALIGPFLLYVLQAAQSGQLPIPVDVPGLDPTISGVLSLAVIYLCTTALHAFHLPTALAGLVAGGASPPPATAPTPSSQPAATELEALDQALQHELKGAS